MENNLHRAPSVFEFKTESKLIWAAGAEKLLLTEAVTPSDMDESEITSIHPHEIFYSRLLGLRLTSQLQGLAAPPPSFLRSN